MKTGWFEKNAIMETVSELSHTLRFAFAWKRADGYNAPIKAGKAYRRMKGQVDYATVTIELKQKALYGPIGYLRGLVVC